MRRPVVRAEKGSRAYRAGDIDPKALRRVSLTMDHGQLLAIMGSFRRREHDSRCPIARARLRRRP